jgi:hypothetical protein
MAGPFARIGLTAFCVARAAIVARDLRLRGDDRLGMDVCDYGLVARMFAPKKTARVGNAYL